MVTIAMPVAADIGARDFTKYSAYIETTGLIRYEGEGAQNSIQTLPLAPPRTDTGNQPNEMPSALGREFAQNDFSHGAGQGWFHKKTSDEPGAKYLYSEGFDISEIGILRHLHAVSENVPSPVFSGATGKTCKQGGYTFITNGTTILRFSDITGAATVIDPHDGESATTVYDICTEGTRIFAALGANGIHVSSDSGATWDHHSDAQAILVAFLKQRLIAATARIFYEITASGATTGMDKTTLELGWTFTSLTETGQFVYASAVYISSDQGGQSRIYHYGPNADLDFIEQGSTAMPDDDLCYAIKGSPALGMVLVGGGRINNSGGKDTLVYKAFPESDGSLRIDLVQDSEGAETRDLACRSIITAGRMFLLGWSLGTSSPYGEREGIARFDPALDSFRTDLASSIDTATPNPVLSIEVVKGRTVFTTADGIFYEDLSHYVDQATLITSTADFNTPAPKNWDKTTLSYKALPNGASVDLQYSLRRPEEGVWAAIDSATVPGSTEATFRHANIESPRWTLKVISNATGSATSAPEIESFATRASQTISESEFRITRTFILADRLMLNRREARMDPREVRDYIEEQYRQIFDYYEADYPQGFYVRLSDYQILEPSDTSYQTTTGNTPEDLYVVMCVFEGTKNA